MLVSWTPLPIPNNFLKQITIILTLNIPSWVTTLDVAGREDDTAPCFMTENIITKSYCCVCKINKQVDCCHGPVRFCSKLRTCFIEHYHFKSICSVGLCVLLLSLHYFMCWTFFALVFILFNWSRNVPIILFCRALKFHVVFFNCMF